jgi:hypothetical protein
MQSPFLCDSSSFGSKKPISCSRHLRSVKSSSGSYYTFPFPFPEYIPLLFCPVFNTCIICVINWTISSRMSVVRPLPLFPFPALPGLLGFVSGIVIYIPEPEGTPSLVISSVVPLSGVCRWLCESLVSGGEMVDGFTAAINRYRAALKVCLLLSHSVGKRSGSRGDRSLLERLDCDSGVCSLSG